MGDLGKKKAAAFKKLGGADDLSVVSYSAKVLTPSPKMGRKERPRGFGR